MHTKASLHVHPAAAAPLRIFEIRRLAKELGCAFVPSKAKPKHHVSPTPLPPNGGGNAA